MLLRLTPWRRGPLLLLRRPGVGLALVAAAFVATLPAAAAPLFLSSAQNAALHRQIAQTCPWRVGARIATSLTLTEVGPAPGDQAFNDAETFKRRAKLTREATPAGLNAPVNTLIATINADPIDRPARNPDIRGLNLVGQDTFADHVQVLAGPGGTGLWIPDVFAEQKGLRVGDTVRLSARATPPFGGAAATKPYELPVAAVFRDLRSLPDQPYWCSVRDLYRGAPGQEFSNTPILSTALVDTATFLAIGQSVALEAGHTIEYELTDQQLTTPDAAVLAQRVGRLRTQVFGADGQLTNPIFDQRTTFTSLLDRQVRRADLVRSGLLPPVVPITLAGVLVGSAVVAAAAVFWVQRRRQELTILAAHGVGAPGLGLKAVTEALPALALGAVGGWSAAWALVRWTGPSPVLSPDSVPVAVGTGGAIAGTALLLVGAVAAVRCRGLADQAPVTHAARWYRRVPWELLLIAAAPVAWLTMAGTSTNEGLDGGVGEVAHVPARLLVVPILVIAGATLLAGRVAARQLRSSGPARTPRRPSGMLAWRRIVRDATTTAVLAGATAVPIAMATYGASVTDSIRTTADGEARTVLGTDVVATLRPGEQLPPLPPALARNSTEVVRIGHQAVGGALVDVLLLDPDTFLRGAYWDDRIDSPSLSSAVQRLTAGPVATVVASNLLPPGDTTLDLLGTTIPVNVVAVQPLPGEQAGYPLLLVHRDVFTSDFPAAEHQLWIRGGPSAVRAELAAAALPLARFSSIDDLRAGAVYEPVTFTFQYLIALSVFTGLIAVVGLLLYLESRTAAHRRAYVLLRRLGLRPRAHRRAVLIELGAPVLVGLLVGLGLAGGLAALLGSEFEVDRDAPPDAILVLPWAMVAAVGVTALVIAGSSATFAHRRVHRANPSEVLRDTP